MKNQPEPILRRSGKYWKFEIRLNNKTQHIAGSFSTKYLLEKTIGKEEAKQWYQKLTPNIKSKKTPNVNVQNPSETFAYDLLGEHLKDEPIMDAIEDIMKEVYKDE